MERDWDHFLEMEKDEAVAKLLAEGFEKIEDGVFITGTWTVVLQRGDERIELSCDPLEAEEVCTGALAPEDAQWFVGLISVWDVKDRDGTGQIYPED